MQQEQIHTTASEWQELLEKHRAGEKKWNRLSLIFGLTKLALLITVFLTVYFIWLRGNPTLGIALTVVQAVIFVAAGIVQAKLNARMRFESGMAELVQKHLDRLEGRWGDFKDTGEELAGPEHEYARDLDIVGKRSLFQLLNSTGTSFGRARFAEDLLCPRYSGKEIRERQRAVAELAGKPEFCCRMELLLGRVGVEESLPQAAERLADGKRRLQSGAVRALFWVLRVLTCGSGLLTLLLPESMAVVPGVMFSVLFLVQLAIWGLSSPQIRPFLAAMAAASQRLSVCGEPVDAFAREPFESEKLRELASVLGGARDPLRSLAGLSRRIGLGNSSILAFILNGLFLWDLWNAASLDSWKQKWGEKSTDWFAALGEAESLLSLANLPRCCTGSCVPEPVEGAGVFTARALGHPLLPNNARVCNDFTLGGGIHIVSGSNMAGKTTFLRTVGINMVLACAGGFACAESLAFSPMRVMTSMRLSDDLSGRISTFYAELQRIKTILDAASQDKSVLFLIDEIFRGTNSVDRLVGAEAVLRRLEELGVSGMITTHDLEICRLADERPRVVNCCFCETYRDGEIFFDYKRREGPSQTTNGQFLLRKVGILAN